MKVIIQCKGICNVAARLIAPPPSRPKVFGLNGLVSVTPWTWLRVWMALVKLQGNWGVAGFGAGLGGGSAVLRERRGRGVWGSPKA